MIATFRALAASKSGASASEYALILCLVFLAIITGVSLLGAAVAAPFAEMGAALAER